MTYWDDVARHTAVAGNWMADPLVRAAINRRVSGDPNVWPVTALRRRIAGRLPLGPCVSIGCGIGGLERSLIEEGITSDVTGVDVSETILTAARGIALDRGMPIRYVNADARAFLREHRAAFDGVFFHQSMHHFDDLDDLIDAVHGALRPSGLLYIDEYVGPSRDAWRWWKLIPANAAYRLMPRGTRRPHLVRAPINREDPTEAIRSGEIVKAIERRFRAIDRRDYGGNLLAVVYPNLYPTSAAVTRLIRLDEWMLRVAPSYCTVMVAVPLH